MIFAKENKKSPSAKCRKALCFGTIANLVGRIKSE
jgi:hypothetical protein